MHHRLTAIIDPHNGWRGSCSRRLLRWCRVEIARGLWARFRHRSSFYTSCHDRHAHDTFQGLIKGRADDDIGVWIDFLADVVGGFVQLKQGHVIAARDVDQHPACALQRHIFQQRIVDGFSCGLQ